MRIEGVIMNQNQENQKDFLEPVVIGTVKKGRTGKPILAIFIILIVGALVYFLPVIGDYFEDRTIIDLIKSVEFINFIKNKNNNKNNSQNTKEEFVLINNNALVENNNLIISALSIKNNVLSYKVRSKTATYDGSKDNLYLQIYIDKEKLVYTKILDEVFSATEKEVKENVNFYNKNNEFYVILKRISDDKIEDITLSSDESGISSVVCSLNNESYEYIFQNKELIEIIRKYQYKYDSSKVDEYQSVYQTYNDLKNEREKYNISIELLEDYVGFTYKENVKLENMDVSVLGKNYYAYKTEAKVVKFKQEAKGFDCE